MKRLLTIALTGMLTISMLVPAWADEVSANVADEEVVVEIEDEATLDEAEADEEEIVIDVDDLEEISEDEAEAEDEEEIDLGNDVVFEEVDEVEELGDSIIPPVSSFGYVNTDRTYPKGMVVQLALPGESIGDTITNCTSSNPSAVAVTPNGVVTVKASKGSAVISVSTDFGNNYTYNIKIAKEWKPNITLQRFGYDPESYKQLEKNGIEYTLKSVGTKSAKLKIKNWQPSKMEVQITKLTLGNKTFKVKGEKITLNAKKAKTIKLTGKFKFNQIGRENLFSVKAKVKFIGPKCH